MKATSIHDHDTPTFLYQTARHTLVLSCLEVVYTLLLLQKIRNWYWTALASCTVQEAFVADSSIVLHTYPFHKHNTFISGGIKRG